MIDILLPANTPYHPCQTYSSRATYPSSLCALDGIFTVILYRLTQGWGMKIQEEREKGEIEVYPAMRLTRPTNKSRE